MTSVEPRATITFPLSEPVPVKLIEGIEKFRATEAAGPEKATAAARKKRKPAQYCGVSSRRKARGFIPQAGDGTELAARESEIALLGYGGFKLSCDSHRYPPMASRAANRSGPGIGDPSKADTWKRTAPSSSPFP